MGIPALSKTPPAPWDSAASREPIGPLDNLERYGPILKIDDDGTTHAVMVEGPGAGYIRVEDLRAYMKHFQLKRED